MAPKDVKKAFKANSLDVSPFMFLVLQNIILDMNQNLVVKDKKKPIKIKSARKIMKSKRLTKK